MTISWEEVPEIRLIRHAAVESRWQGICYGAMNVALSEAGRAASDRLAERLVRNAVGDAADTLGGTQAPRLVFHSGLARTRYLAERIAALSDTPVEVCEDVRLRERNYGRWQGISWDDAYASDPGHFHDLIEKPDTYRPPDGETTSEMQQRMVAWLQDCETIERSVEPPRSQTAGQRKEKRAAGSILAISHSGPIAAIAGHVRGLPATQWAPWMTRNLESILLRYCPESSTRWTVERATDEG